MSTTSEPDASTAVALLRAGMRQDERAVQAIYDTSDLRGLLMELAGVTWAIGAQVLGSVDNFDAFLADWQQERLKRAAGGYTDGDGTG